MQPEPVTQDCPKCKGTGKLHGEFKFESGDLVTIRHRGRWYDGVVTKRHIQPAYYGGYLSDTYAVTFTLASGRETTETFQGSYVKLREDA